MDESWIYVYDPHLKETTREWLRKDEPRPQEPIRGISVSKTMIVTFDSHGLIYYKFVQRPATVNQIVPPDLAEIRPSLHEEVPKSYCSWLKICAYGQC